MSMSKVAFNVLNDVKKEIPTKTVKMTSIYFIGAIVLILSI